MTTICSWCQAETRTLPAPGESHGICERHLAIVRQQITPEQRRRQTEIRKRLTKET